MNNCASRVTMICFVLVYALLIASCGSSNGLAITSNTKSKRLSEVIPRYQKLAHLPWSPIIYHGPITVGTHNTAIPRIRRRLIALGDLSTELNSTSDFYDQALKDAVIRFQWRHGLKPDGKIGKKTIAALNVSPRKRLHQLKLNMRRWASIPEGIGKRYIHVNIPSYELNLVEDGAKVMKMRVIVGKPKRPTPILYSKVQTLVFNPKWNVPYNIAKKDIIPKVIEDPNYLAENNISVYSSWKKNAYRIDPKKIDWVRAQKEGFRYRLSQSPGDFNALGRVKFIFLNDHDVYMHDTPQRGLFQKIQRAFSSGCIRLEKPFQLVEYFIQNDEKLEHEQVYDYLSKRKIKYVRIRNPIPLYITYITAWVDRQGIPHFREDIYQRDVY